MRPDSSSARGTEEAVELTRCSPDRVAFAELARPIVLLDATAAPSTLTPLSALRLPSFLRPAAGAALIAGSADAKVVVASQFSYGGLGAATGKPVRAGQIDRDIREAPLAPFGRDTIGDRLPNSPILKLHGVHSSRHARLGPVLECKLLKVPYREHGGRVIVHRSS